MSFLEGRLSPIRSFARCLVLVFMVSHASRSNAQGLANSGQIRGQVTDSTGAVIPGAKIEIHNPVTAYQSSTTSDQSGQFRIDNVPFNRYHMSVSAAGFTSREQDVEVRAAVPVQANISLQIAGTTQSVTVEAGSEDVLENTPSNHTDIDVGAIKLPTSTNSALSSLITNATPGVAADSNGFFHPLGEHADTTFSIDGQPISDQQSRIFANQLSPNAIQSLEVINGLIPPEFGDKSSLVVRATTRSGLGLAEPTGSVSFGYGLPAIFPYLVTGFVTASGGAWNASIVAEYFHFKGQTFSTVGLGGSGHQPGDRRRQLSSARRDHRYGSNGRQHQPPVVAAPLCTFFKPFQVGELRRLTRIY
jgi:hypothetical protein